MNEINKPNHDFARGSAEHSGFKLNNDDQKNLEEDEFDDDEEEEEEEKEEHLVEEGQFEEEETKPPRNFESPMQKILRSKVRRFLIPIYLILVIFLFYKFLGWYGKRKQDIESKTPPQPTVVATRPAAAPVQTPSPPPSPAVDEVLLQKFENLRQNVQQNQEQITTIKNKMDDNQKTFDNLNNSVTTLTASVEELTAKVDNLIYSMKKKPKKKVKKIIPPKVTYHIKAIVPGRAWLEDCRGKTITVRLGDIINGGRVEMISPTQGIVATSTGEIIQYGANDF